MTIAPNSDSYPVQGAAMASGVSYGLALAWVDAEDRDIAAGVATAIWMRHGTAAWETFHELISAAFEPGVVRIRWAVVR